MFLYILRNYFQMKRQERVAVGRRRRSAPPLPTATRQHLFYTAGTNCIPKTKKMFFKHCFNQCKRYSQIERSPRFTTPDCPRLHLLYILYTTSSSRKQGLHEDFKNKSDIRCDTTNVYTKMIYNWKIANRLRLDKLQSIAFIIFFALRFDRLVFTTFRWGCWILRFLYHNRFFEIRIVCFNCEKRRSSTIKPSSSVQVEIHSFY